MPARKPVDQNILNPQRQSQGTLPLASLGQFVYGFTRPLSTAWKNVVASSTSTGTEITGGTNFFFAGLAASALSEGFSTDSFVSSVLSTRGSSSSGLSNAAFSLKQDC